MPKAFNLVQKLKKEQFKKCSILLLIINTDKVQNWQLLTINYKSKYS